ncbi:MAG: hypothetical protein CBC35_08710 [Planctomycetes bacterium TMED75]|nr:hypothetical protein [Planctomycetaceae bacterium]OUU91757.1 MAG: hypothetical protein CBC35_08710 [Planctomycetes bacterium TMED75]
MSNRHDAQGIPVNSNQRRLIQASIVADAHSVHAPGVVLLHGHSVVAAGSPELVGQVAPDVVVEDWSGYLITPPLVNAHVHLDLTDLDPLPQELDFDAWLAAIIQHRAAQQAPGRVEEAVQRGAAASLAGGCPYVGDICGSARALDALIDSPLEGVGFIELFGHGSRAEHALEAIELVQSRAARDAAAPGLRPGLSPHAPYSAGPEVYRAAQASGLPVATHLAESPEELQWCMDGGGAFAGRLEQMGYDLADVPVPGGHPLDLYPSLLPAQEALVAHANYAQPHHIAQLQACGATVVYCPRAYRYFGHPHGEATGHEWRHMLAAGVPVALGTDGRPCLPATGPAAERLSVLDEVACLQHEEGVSLADWLPMVTLHGARGLGIADDQVLLVPGVKKALPAIPLSPQGQGHLDLTRPLVDLFKSS